MTKHFISLFSPASAGLLLYLMLTGCVTQETPEQITLAFWVALAHGDTEKAKKYATEDSRDLVSSPSIALDNAAIKIGQIVIDGDHATVETLIHTPNDSTPTETANTFSTVLIRKNNQWKIDYRQTSSNLSKNPFAGFFRSLQNLGDKLNKQLEQAIPKIEQELESFGSKLERQMDEFNNELEKSFPTQPDDQKPDSI